MTTQPPDRSPDSISAGKSIEPLGKPVPSGRPPEGFESHMRPPGQTPSQGTQGLSPMEIARPQPIASAGVSVQSILAQANTMQDALGEVHKNLNFKNLKLKRSQEHLVKQKLTDANRYIESASHKLGAKSLEEPNAAGLVGISRFLSMVGHGQDMVGEVQNQLAAMSKSQEPLSPAEMLSVQVKMGLAQQEIEYTSTLLGKVIQSITQILNTQL